MHRDKEKLVLAEEEEAEQIDKKMSVGMHWRQINRPFIFESDAMGISLFGWPDSTQTHKQLSMSLSRPCKWATCSSPSS